MGDCQQFHRYTKTYSRILFPLINMQNKELELFISGINKAVDKVKVTMGPRGRNVVMAKRYGPPSISNDGLNILRQVKLSDPYENAGAQLVIALAERMNELAGDATTTVSVLFDELVRESFRHALPGVDVMALSRGMEQAGKDIVAELEAIKRPLRTKKEIQQIATISVESEKLGEIIADIVQKVGKDGVVTVEESQSFGIESEIVEGLEFESGFASIGMTTNKDFKVAEYRDIPILITDKKITAFNEIVPIMSIVGEKKIRGLVIIADDIDGPALRGVLLNMMNNGLPVLVIKAPGHGAHKRELLEDIAVTVGAKVIFDGIKLEDAKFEMLGKARKVRATSELTTIIGGAGKKSAIKARVEQLKEQMKVSEIKYEKEKLQERVGKLTGGVAIIYVGAPTERESGYKKDKIEDSVNATRGALQEGIVMGGGSAFIKIIGKLGQRTTTEAESTGYNLVIKALSRPLEQIAENVGREDGKVIVYQVKQGSKNCGYDALNDTIVKDMFAAGIIDSVRSLRNAVQLAVSEASTLITTGPVLLEDVKES